MPLMHRLGCLRDDVVFFIYLYQKYAYPVDLTRRNEYGQAATDEEDAARRARGEVKRGGRDKWARVYHQPAKGPD
jgi:hypothetical protein